jgi:hypothetical protein
LSPELDAALTALMARENRDASHIIRRGLTLDVALAPLAALIDRARGDLSREEWITGALGAALEPRDVPGPVGRVRGRETVLAAESRPSAMVVLSSPVGRTMNAAMVARQDRLNKAKEGKKA